MTAKDALQLLDRLIAEIRTDRATHFAAVRAIETLAKAVEDEDVKKKPEKSG